MQSSAQVGYNFQFDMLANIPHVNAPETETLGFNHNIDSYRYVVGPAALAGKRVVSSEAGAVMLDVYQQTIPYLLWDLKRSIVGGVNNFVLHGMPFSGNYANTTWPGFVTFFFLFSEMHNRHQPGWDYYRDFINYTARLQQAMQTGVPKVDLVFWLKNDTYANVSTKYWPTDLEEAGYSYEYLSPNNFDLPMAQVVEGVLAPDAQAFKALILRRNETLTSFGVAKLSQWALQGLPVIISGGMPTNFSGSASTEELQSTNATLYQLTTLSNVHVVPYDNLARSLASLGISPRTSVSPTGPIWYSRWRETEEEVIVFLYYDASTETGPLATNKSITFAVTGTPYHWDAWTGDQTLITQYLQTNSSTTIPLSLTGNQTTIIAFKRNEHSIPQQQQSTVTQDSATRIPLSNWTLTVESWTAPENFYNVEGVVKTNTTYQITTLLPWNKLSVGTNLTYVSGRGYYHSTFTWPPASGESHALITMSPILHTAVLYVNGQKARPLDVTAPRADITQYLRPGLNDVDIIVSTPLGNALIPVQNQLRSAGAAPFTSISGPKEYGLVGEVVLTTH